MTRWKPDWSRQQRHHGWERRPRRSTRAGHADDVGQESSEPRHAQAEATEPPNDMHESNMLHGREQRHPVRRVDLVGRHGLELVHVKGADREGDLGRVRALVLVVDDEIDQRAVLVLELGQCLGDL